MSMPTHRLQSLGGICVDKREDRFIYYVHEAVEQCRWQGLMNDAGICTIYAVWAPKSFNQNPNV